MVFEKTYDFSTQNNYKLIFQIGMTIVYVDNKVC